MASIRAKCFWFRRRSTRTVVVCRFLGMGVTAPPELTCCAAIWFCCVMARCAESIRLLYVLKYCVLAMSFGRPSRCTHRSKHSQGVRRSVLDAKQDLVEIMSEMRDQL